MSESIIKISMEKNIKKLLIALLFGTLMGLLITFFFKTLFWIQLFQEKQTYYIFLLPFVWLLLKFTKKMTLYFPVSVSEVHTATPEVYKYWFKFGLFYNFMGSVLGHFAGASIGREGTAITLASSLANVFRLDWPYWRPIVISASFGVATGSPLVAIVFLIEVFSSKLDQKFLTLLMAWIASLILESFQVPHLLHPIFVLGIDSFYNKLFFVIIAGAFIGFISRCYKSIYFRMKIFFQKKSIWLGFMLLVCASAILYQPQFKSTHSLSLDQFQSVQLGQIAMDFVFYKLIFTLFFVAVGFWGGDFVPSVLIGSGLGVIFAKFLSIDPMFGLMLGSFSFFCGLTRLKWTALFLTASILVGYQQLVWVYLFLTVCRWFSGTLSVYTTEASIYENS